MRSYVIALILSMIIHPALSQDVVYDSVWSFTKPAETGNPSYNNKQDLNFSVHGAYRYPVKKTSLVAANSLSDFIDGYPKNWLTDLISAELSTMGSGKSYSAGNSSSTLSSKQKSILTLADIGSNIIISVKYKTQNSATNDIEIRTMKMELTVVPEVEAEFTGGQAQMKRYIKENAINKITADEKKDVVDGKYLFTVNENGIVIDVKIVKSAGKASTDNLFLDAISKMPKWKSALDLKGAKVKQVFELSVGNGGC